MLGLYVRGRNALARFVRREQGLTAVEYGVFAAFVVLAVATMAISIGPKLSAWMQESICSIIEGEKGVTEC